MLRTSLEFVSGEIAEYMFLKDPGTYTNRESIVHLSGLTYPDGSSAIDSAKHIMITLAKMEEERLEGKAPYYINTSDDKYARKNPAVTLNFYLLFIACNKNYSTALRDLSHVVSFFQGSPVFDKKKFPGLNNPSDPAWKQVEKLVFYIQPLSFEQENNIWSSMGAKYMPSIMYKVRMLTIASASGEETEPIKEIQFKEN